MEKYKKKFSEAHIASENKKHNLNYEKSTREMEEYTRLHYSLTYGKYKKEQ